MRTGECRYEALPNTEMADNEATGDGKMADNERMADEK